MADLSYLFSGTPPTNVNSSTVESNGLPAWYQEYLRGLAGKAVGLAGAQADMPLPGQSVAGFTPDQVAAFAATRDNQGAWQPGMAQAQQMTQGAAGAISPTSASWADPGVAQQYMSPYTGAVVDNIARLGARNFNENLMPGINDQMVGSGQFGSTRNADVLARAARDTNLDIMGKQSEAMQSGYQSGQQTFASDASRQQQQQQLRGSAMLQGGAQLGQLAQSQAGLGYADAGALEAVGRSQQEMQQMANDAGYTNQMNAINYDWGVLSNLSNLIRGMEMPQMQTTLENKPVNNTPGTSPLSTVAGWFS